MQIQVNSDRSIAVDTALVEQVETGVRNVLERFSDRLTRVEVHLSDINGERSGVPDKRCLMEVRPTGRDPVVVTDQALTVDLAVRGASQKMRRLLESTFGRLEEKR
jgi:hypothetical protein